MTCNDFFDTMPDQARLDHAAVCPRCAARLERERELAGGLHALGIRWRPRQAPSRVEARLVAAFRNDLGRGPAARSTPWWMPLLAWTAATFAVASLAVFLVWGRPVEPRLPRLAAAQLAVAMPVDFYAPGDGGNDFIPLPNAAEVAPNEAVDLVRVEVPRSAMIALGFTVSPERASEPIEADVMLGPDGVARAVRFLDE